MVLYVLQVIITQSLVRGTDKITCSEDHLRWEFSDCSLALYMYASHVLASMQSVGIVRMVFVKTTKSVTASEQY